MTALSVAGRHPLLECVQVIEAALDETADLSPAFMELDAKRELLLRLARVAAKTAALQLRTAAVADDVADYDGARDVGTWLAHRTRDDGRELRRQQVLAQALDRRWSRVAAGLSEGAVNLAQAHVITRALEALPADVGDEIAAEAEAHLVAQAAHYGPRDLTVLGRKVLEVIAPEIGERQEARQLAAEERRARETTSLTTQRLGDGSTRILIKVPDAIATRLCTYLEAFTSPRRASEHYSPAAESAVAEGESLPMPRKLGRAFCSLLESVDPRRLPLHGGDATTVIVTVPLEALQADLAAAGVAGADRLSATEARRLACTSQVIPAVLGGKSEVLDLGRSSRLFSPAQRKALAIRDRCCRAEGCTIPATWCEAHHAGAPWAQGGRTDLDDGLLLCSHHHHRVHDPAYEHTRLGDGDLRFHRRT